MLSGDFLKVILDNLSAIDQKARACYKVGFVT